MRNTVKFVVVVVILLLNSVVYAENEDNNEKEMIEVAKIQNEFKTSQFILELRQNQPKNVIEEYLFVIDHSSNYTISVKTWNKFVKNYYNVSNAIRAYKQGWAVEFDDILN